MGLDAGMNPRTLFVPALVVLFAGVLSAGPALTIYNQDFAAVRESVSLDLKKGVNAVVFADATLKLEPDSVLLRDPAGKVALRILEQSYRADIASQGLLLSKFEGRALDFLVRDSDGKEYTVSGKVIRSGHAPGDTSRRVSPIIEVDGLLRFSLPGEPLFPSLNDDAILRPTLSWQIESDRAARLDAELGYLTGGLSWSAAYNLVAPEKGDTLDLVGWVTMRNQSGKTFADASVKLMAGDVNKVERPEFRMTHAAMADPFAPPPAPQVTEKAFDEFHLYSLARPVTLRDQETKQVEFLRATGIKSKTLYIYDGVNVSRYPFWSDEAVRNEPDYGTWSNSKVAVYREFKNSKENGLGLPLPKGLLRFYRQDDADRRIEFTGENTIDHTPEGETVRINTGDAFDLVGERIRTDFVRAERQDQMEEAFTIKLRNRKKEPVEIRVTERLYRWVNWTIIENSDDFEKIDARNIEFRVKLQPDEEKTVTYRVRYDWK